MADAEKNSQAFSVEGKTAIVTGAGSGKDRISEKDLTVARMLI
jgi:hypothetical protein